MSEHGYSVDIRERLADIRGEDGLHVGPRDTVVYEWRGGYEILTVSHEGGGSSEYRGVYHPNDGMCEGHGVCVRCGRTLW